MTPTGEVYRGMTEQNRTQFKPVQHHLHPDVTVVEVYAPQHQGGGLIGVLYPSADGFTFVSKFLDMDGTVMAVETGEPPVMIVRLQHETQ